MSGIYGEVARQCSNFSQTCLQIIHTSTVKVCTTDILVKQSVSRKHNIINQIAHTSLGMAGSVHDTEHAVSKRKRILIAEKLIRRLHRKLPMKQESITIVLRVCQKTCIVGVYEHRCPGSLAKQIN